MPSDRVIVSPLAGSDANIEERTTIHSFKSPKHTLRNKQQDVTKHHESSRWRVILSMATVIIPFTNYFSVSQSINPQFPPVGVLCVRGRLLIENAVGVSREALANLRYRVTQLWGGTESLRGKFPWHFSLTEGWEQNIIMTTQHKKQTFHYSGQSESSCTQVDLFKSSDNHDISERY